MEMGEMGKVAERPKPRRGKLTEGPNPVDVHVGVRLRLRRTLLGMSQETLGEAVALTFQQIQKYERGANRIGASRLYQFSRILGVPIGFFFEDMPDDLRTLEGQLTNAPGLSDQQQDPLEIDPIQRRESLELVRNYYKISDPDIRRHLFDLAESLSRSAPKQDAES